MSIVVFETEHPTHSKLLDAKGQPIPYQPRPKLGFDLTPKAQQQQAEPKE